MTNVKCDDLSVSSDWFNTVLSKVSLNSVALNAWKLGVILFKKKTFCTNNYQLYCLEL